MPCSSQSTSDKFFCGEENPLTVDGTPGLFALSDSEWNYLIETRPNATKLREYGVTVENKRNCLIIAPDTFTGTLKSSYTLAEVNALGLVCLPSTGYRNGSYIKDEWSYGSYWSGSPYSDYSGYAYYLRFYSGLVGTNYGDRSHGHSVRLVRLAQ